MFFEFWQKDHLKSDIVLEDNNSVFHEAVELDCDSANKTVEVHHQATSKERKGE